MGGQGLPPRARPGPAEDAARRTSLQRTRTAQGRPRARTPLRTRPRRGKEDGGEAAAAAAAAADAATERRQERVALADVAAWTGGGGARGRRPGQGPGCRLRPTMSPPGFPGGVGPGATASASRRRRRAAVANRRGQEDVARHERNVTPEPSAGGDRETRAVRRRARAGRRGSRGFGRSHHDFFSDTHS